MKDYDNSIEESENVIDLYVLFGDLLGGIKRLWWIMVLLILITTGLSCYMEYKNYAPYYTASATFTVSLNSDKKDTSMLEENTKATLMSKTFPYIITNGILKDIVQKDLGLDYITEDITAENIENTNLFTINVVSDDAKRAYDVLQSVIKNYPKLAEPVVGSTHLTMLDQTGVPGDPDNKKDYKRSMAKGAIPGAAVGVILLLAYAFTRKTIRKAEDLTKLTSMKNLGILPEVVFKKRGKKSYKIVSIRNDKVTPWYKECIYKIRTRVEKAMNNQSMKSVLVTSALSGEGKSTFALNLALAIAEQDKKVVLVDCDLHKPSIHKMVTLQYEAAGLEKVLNEEAELTEALQYSEEDKITILGGLTSVANASEIIGTNKMEEIIRQLEEMFDVIVIDTAPSAVLSDTSVLARFVDGLIYVVKQDYAKVNQILESLDNLSESSNIKIIGSVINGTKSGISGYGYNAGYGYGYGRYGSERRKTKNKMELDFNKE